MEGWERIKLIIEKEGLNKNSFSAAIGLNNNVTITRIINEHRSPSRSTCEKIVSAFPKYKLEWLLYGEGEMLSNNSGIIGNNNKGNIYRGDFNNNISISLPEKGTQKIIDPDGTVTIENTSSGAHDYLNEINRLSQRIQDLERIISGHEATIKSLETTIKSKDDLICILRSSLDKQD